MGCRLARVGHHRRLAQENDRGQEKICIKTECDIIDELLEDQHGQFLSDIPPPQPAFPSGAEQADKEDFLHQLRIFVVFNYGRHDTHLLVDVVCKVAGIYLVRHGPHLVYLSKSKRLASKRENSHTDKKWFLRQDVGGDLFLF